MTVRVATVISALICMAALTGRAAAQPPTGLTRYGELIWNLDALLHDTFGSRPVYINYVGTSQEGVFSTRFMGVADSFGYEYTFANSRHSDLQAIKPARPPKPVIGVAGSAYPLRLGSAYISCGAGKWLFQHSGGGGNANLDVFCER